MPLDSSIHEEIRTAFARLDVTGLLRLEKALAGKPLNDMARVAFAFAHHASGQDAEAILASLEGDGKAPRADLAYVRAFMNESASDYGAVVNTLSQHLDDPDATHSGRMRLRVGDALMRLGRYQEIEQALGPVLQPPGNQFTLEGHCIVLEAMLRSGAPKEKLIEYAAVIDGLAERGFAMQEVPNALYYAQMLEKSRIETVVPRLLNAHSGLLDRYETANREEIEYLLAAGEKFKVPAAVRAAGRSYAKNPFPWHGSEPEKIAYLFASHEEHEAALQTILAHYGKKEIESRQELWGILLIESYNAGRWKETLELYTDHRREIAKLPIADNAAMIRAVAQHHLGRHGEFLQSVEQLGEAFYKQASGEEAAREGLSLAAVGREKEIPEAAKRAFSARRGEQEFAGQYASTMLNECTIRELGAALSAWIAFLPSILPAEQRGLHLFRLAEVVSQWSMLDQAEELAELTTAAGDPGRGAMLRGAIAAARGEALAAERFFEEAIRQLDGPGRSLAILRRGNARRRLEDARGAAADVETALADATFPGRYAVLALRAALLRESGAPDDQIQQALNESMAAIRALNPSAEQAVAMRFDAQQVFAGDSPAAMLHAAQVIAHSDFGSVEVLRLGRKAARAFDATEEIRNAAEELCERWRAENL